MTLGREVAVVAVGSSRAEGGAEFHFPLLVGRKGVAHVDAEGESVGRFVVQTLGGQKGACLVGRAKLVVFLRPHAAGLKGFVKKRFGRALVAQREAEGAVLLRPRFDEELVGTGGGDFPNAANLSAVQGGAAVSLVAHGHGHQATFAVFEEGVDHPRHRAGAVFEAHHRAQTHVDDQRAIGRLSATQQIVHGIDNALFAPVGRHEQQFALGRHPLVGRVGTSRGDACHVCAVGGHRVVVAGSGDLLRRVVAGAVAVAAVGCGDGVLVPYLEYADLLRCVHEVGVREVEARVDDADEHTATAVGRGEIGAGVQQVGHRFLPDLVGQWSELFAHVDAPYGRFLCEFGQAR